MAGDQSLVRELKSPNSRDKKSRLVVARGEAEEEETVEEVIGHSGLAKQSIMYRMDKHQDPTIWHMEHIQYSLINHNGKEREKQNMYN